MNANSLPAQESTLDASPRRFGSLGEALRDLIGVAQRARSLAFAYRPGGLDPALRERVMVGVSRVNSCRGCSFVHVRLASRAGVSTSDLEAIDLGNLATLDDRNRVAVAYATALAEARFRDPIPDHVAAGAAVGLTLRELRAIEAVARGMALANLSVNTVGALIQPLRCFRSGGSTTTS